jgi:hypothetical protein
MDLIFKLRALERSRTAFPTHLQRRNKHKEGGFTESASVAHRSRRQGLRAGLRPVLAGALRAALTAALRCAPWARANPPDIHSETIMTNQDPQSNGADGSSTPAPTASFSLQRYYDDKAAHVRRRLPELAQQLRAIGIVCVEVHYDGVGDSGQIESIDYFDKSRKVPFPKGHVGFTEDEIDDLFYDLTQMRHPGWENEDGAFGDIRWDVVGDQLAHVHHDRFTDYNTTEHEGL